MKNELLHRYFSTDLVIYGIVFLIIFFIYGAVTLKSSVQLVWEKFNTLIVLYYQLLSSEKFWKTNSFQDVKGSL